MKIRMKKHLSVLLAVLMLLTSVGFSAGAADCQHEIDPTNPNYRKIVYPTCDTDGYTIYYCKLCSDVASGNMVEVSRGASTPAVGHVLNTEFEYISDGNGAYNKVWKCVNKYYYDGAEHAGDAMEYELEFDGTPAVYYLVEFINNKVTDLYDESVTYTNIAKTYKEKKLYECYVKKGSEAFYEGRIPVRDKSLEFGDFELVGWTTNPDLPDATVDDNLDSTDCTSITAINGNTTLYPVFRGVPVTYKVVFYDDKTQTTLPKDVVHGQFPQYSFNGELYPNPTKADDIVNYYKFNGWATKKNQTSGISTENIETTPVYAGIHYYPAFTSVAKNYTVEFYDYTGNELVKYDGNKAVFKGVNLGVSLLSPVYQYHNDIAAVNNKDNAAFDKPSDSTYYYEWTGMWQVLREDGSRGSVINLSDIFNITEFDYFVRKGADNKPIILEGSEFNEPEKVIRLVPVFTQRLRRYAVDIEMVIPSTEDSNYYLGGAEVSVVDKNGQLAAIGKTDANGIFRCTLNYNPPFAITVATSDGKYIGNAEISNLLKPEPDTGNLDIEASLNKCSVIMRQNPEYETHCGCIHHNSLLQPIIVRIFNILYTFFNVRYVCCYDMYSTIGPLLSYTPN